MFVMKQSNQMIVMNKDGYVFYKSVNGVWLTENVPAEYLQKQ